MDAVEILLFGVVGLSVLVFLILDKLDPQFSKQSGDVHDSDNNKCRIQESGRDHSVGGEGDAVESQILERESFQESEEREETDNNLVTNASCGKALDEYVVDDWEGVERSELEKIFGEAMVCYANHKSNINGNNGIGEDVKLQLYGLQKVALEGPCPHNSQPMALHLSARSKWNAWQKVGNMSAEMAMENYIAILSEAIPEWKQMNHNLQSKGDEDTQLIKIRRYLRI